MSTRCSRPRVRRPEAQHVAALLMLMPLLIRARVGDDDHLLARLLDRLGYYSSTSKLHFAEYSMPTPLPMRPDVLLLRRVCSRSWTESNARTVEDQGHCRDARSSAHTATRIDCTNTRARARQSELVSSSSSVTSSSLSHAHPRFSLACLCEKAIETITHEPPRRDRK